MRRWGWVVCSVLLCGSAFAEEPRTYPQGGVQIFLGLDDTSAPTQVQDGRAQDLQNVTLDISRGIRQRYGYDRIGDTCDIPDQAFPPITGLYYTKFSSGTERIVRTCATRFQYLNGNVWTNLQTSGPVAITAGQNNQFVFTTALDQIIGTNDVDRPLMSNGTFYERVNFSGLTDTVSAAKTVAFFKNYLIFGNLSETLAVTPPATVERPTRIRWSKVGTINTWGDEDFIDISALGGQEIVAFAELYDNLYVFLTDSIYKMSLVGGDDIFQISKVTDDIGCIAKNSVQSITLTNATNGLVFLDKDKKVYFFNGVIAQDISTLIQETLGALSGNRLQYAVSADTNTDYLLCVTNGTVSSNNLCLDLEYEIGEWTKHVNLNANAMAHVLDANADDQVYFGDYYGFTHQFSDSSLRDDIGSLTGSISAVDRFTTATASGLQMLYVTGATNLVTGFFAGAPLKLVGGTGSGQTNTIADNTASGLVVVTDFTTTPTNGTTFEVGAIDSFYTTKWYDMGEAARLKHFGEVYFWADADVSSSHAISYATDFNSDISTQSISLSSNTTDAIWGSAIWGTSLWGDVDNIFRQVKLESQGRYLRIKFAEDDPGQTFHLYGWVPVFWAGDIN